MECNISQLIRFANVCCHVDDFAARIKITLHQGLLEPKLYGFLSMQIQKD